MAPIRSVGRILIVVALTGGLLALACPQAWSASNAKLFTETWQDHEQCQKFKASGTVFVVCNEVSGGKFTIKATISQSTSGASGTLTPSLLTNPSTEFSITLGGYTFQGTMGNFKVKASKTKATATQSFFTQMCNALGQRCKNFKYEQIKLTVTNKGTLVVSISATTGSDANGDTFENSIDAENFDGEATGPVSDSLFLQIDLGTFNFNDANINNVAVTGTVKTKPAKGIGTSSVNNLSNIKITGTLQP